MAIKQISFDLWNTLIRANPAYAEARTELLFSDWNPNRLSHEEVYAIYKAIDLRNDWLNERCAGMFQSTQVLYATLIYELGNPIATPSDLLTLEAQLQRLVKQFPPVAYDGDTRHVLRELKGIGYRLTIGSNTAFITGEILRGVVIPALGITFDALFFSDEIGLAKPDREFFDLIRRRSGGNGSNSILHVGDNPITDQAGPNTIGMPSLLINSNGLSITDVMTHISHARTV